MSCKKQPNLTRRKQQQVKVTRRQNKTVIREAVEWLSREPGLFPKQLFHGNVKWKPEQLASLALVWAWQETKYVTNAFEHALEVCDELGMGKTAQSYTSMMNALVRYSKVLMGRLLQRLQTQAQAVGGRHWQTGGWVPMAFDGSRITAPRTVSNEQAFCAANYGKGKRAQYGKKKSQGLRRERNKQNPPHPPAPQVWVTLLWHMQLRLPWTWRLGPSNSSERGHVLEMLMEEEFPDSTLFCGDAGFIGYPFWSQFEQQGYHFLVRIGGNVNLLSEHADFKKIDDGLVLCWPKGQMASGNPPLRLRLVKVMVGKTQMWLLTNALDPEQLTREQIKRFYKMRWGIEVEFRGLKQTLAKRSLRCRNADRLMVELNWSLYGMAVAELLALREQVAAAEEKKDTEYNPQRRSLAETMRALRKYMRTPSKYTSETEGLCHELSKAIVQRYTNRTDKRARYRPKNPDKKELGEPTIRKLASSERKMLAQHTQAAAA